MGEHVEGMTNKRYHNLAGIALAWNGWAFMAG